MSASHRIARDRDSAMRSVIVKLVIISEIRSLLCCKTYIRAKNNANQNNASEEDSCFSRWRWFIVRATFPCGGSVRS